MAQAGHRTELIAFERMSHVDDAGGGYAVVWSVIGGAWAMAKWASGDEQERSGGVRTRQRYRFVVPAAAVDDLALTEGDRIVWQGDPWNIRERPRRITGTASCEIFAEFGVAQ